MKLNDEMLQEFGAKGHRTVYVCEHYRDSKGIGSEALYTEKEEAIEAAKKEWHMLLESDKNSFLQDNCSYFRVASAELFYEPCAEEWQIHPDRQEILWDFKKE